MALTFVVVGDHAMAADGELVFYSRDRKPLGLPQKWSVSGGLHLGIYQLTQEQDDSTPDLESGLALQGGFLTFKVKAETPASATQRLPVPIKWKSVEWFAGSHRGATPGEVEPSFVESFVAISLRREDVDLLRDRKAEASRPLSIRTHLVVQDHEALTGNGIRFSADPQAVRAAMLGWRKNHPMDLQLLDAVGQPDPVLITLTEVVPFVKFCAAQEGIRMVDDDEAILLAAFTAMRMAWMDYRLANSASAVGAVPVVVWKENATPQKSIDLTWDGWAEVERYVLLDVNAQEAAWTETWLNVDGFARETRQRIHFVLLDDWTQTGLKSLAVEVELVDPLSGYITKATVSLPVPGDQADATKPFIKELKGRYSAQLKMKWRVVFGMTLSGKIIRLGQPLDWMESRIPNFDAFVQLNPDDVMDLLRTDTDKRKEQP
ncbi:hypothetical protein FEM03_00510 [Phragmitibacter flavus]|uniref:Uncharacterized protein n=2 Tax=Phragmitibacter flavus TaxID=2576071 RepID=A0A5R8KJX4_9BACT|nr:hypothetical protein FEM03_00510 [Phragmitibacter flavus]